MLLYNGYTEDQKMSIEHFGMNMVRAFMAKVTQPGGYANAGAIFSQIRKYFVTDITLEDIVDNKDLWYAYSAFGKLQIDIVGSEAEEEGLLVFKINDSLTIERFVPYRKSY